MPSIDWATVRLELHEPAKRQAGFFSFLEQTINHVGQLQAEADKQVAALLRGNGLDIHTALVAVEKADLSFQLMMQVRNKIIQAYQEISRMPF